MAEHLIFHHPPDTWQELQNYVGQLFSEMGFEVEVTKTWSGAKKKLMSMPGI